MYVYEAKRVRALGDKKKNMAVNEDIECNYCSRHSFRA